MRRVLFALALAGSSLVGCSSNVEKFCAKSVECSLTQDTEETCITEGDKTVAHWDEKGDKCATVREKFDAFIDCASGASCDELKKTEGGACDKEAGEYIEAVMGTSQDCNPSK